MALGDVTQIIPGQSYAVELLASVAAANGIPTQATDGLAVNELARFGKVPSKIRVGIKSTAGSGAMTVTARVWLHFGTLGWMVGKALAASTAAPQTAVAIAETGADTIGYSEDVTVIAGADRIFLEVIALAGTTPAFTGYAIVGRE